MIRAESIPTSGPFLIESLSQTPATERRRLGRPTRSEQAARVNIRDQSGYYSTGRPARWNKESVNGPRIDRALPPSQTGAARRRDRGSAREPGAWRAVLRRAVRGAVHLRRGRPALRRHLHLERRVAPRPRPP